MSSSEPLSKWGPISAVIGVPVLVLTLYFTARWSANAWWFFVTTLAAYLVAEVVTKAYDRGAARTKKQYWLPIKFVTFAELIVFAALLGELANSEIKVGLFDSPLTVGFFVFWGLNLLLPTLLFVNFILHGRYYMTSKSKMRPVEMRYLGLILLFLAGGLILTAYGTALSGSYFSATQTTSETSFKGMSLGWSNSTTVQNHAYAITIKNVNMEVDVTIPTKEVDVFVTFYDHLSQTHTFALILPFPVRPISALNQGSLSGNVSSLRAFNITDSSSVLEFTWRDFYNISQWQENQVFVRSYATGDVISSFRGEYEFYLPLGFLPSQAALQNASEVVPQGLHFYTVSGYNVTAAVTIPQGSKLVQVLPSTAFQGETVHGVPGTLYVWVFKAPQTASSVSVDYQDTNEVGSYQNDLFLGGIWTGIGASAIIGAVFEMGRFYYELKKDEPRPQVPEN